MDRLVICTHYSTNETTVSTRVCAQEIGLNAVRVTLASINLNPQKEGGTIRPNLLNAQEFEFIHHDYWT